MDQFWTILNNSDSFEHIFSKTYCNMDPLRKNYTSVICHRYFASLVKKFEFSVPKWIETCRTGQMVKSVHEPKPAPNLGARPQKQAQMRSSSNFKSASCVNWSYTVSFLQVSAASGALVESYKQALVKPWWSSGDALMKFWHVRCSLWSSPINGSIL